jgi:uncharacterized protein DUF6458
MGIGISIFLLAVGLILRFALTISWDVAGVSVDWDIVGDILIGVGAFGLAFSVWTMRSARRDAAASYRPPSDFDAR